MDRRSFLKVAGGALAAPMLGGILSACGAGGTQDSGSGSGGGGGGGSRSVRLGFIALTDCASVVMASELGYFAERDLQVSVEKQANWAATRDNLLNGEIDGAHCLFGMPFSVATGIGGSGSSDLRVAMMLNNNGQAITLAKEFAGVGYGDLPKAKAALTSKAPTLAMTFPGGTHDLWLRYWLKAAGVDEKALKIITIPPAQMVANMKVNAMDGFCVGEPWGAVAADTDIGFTHLNTQDIWKHHPEKALVVNQRFASERTDVLSDVMGAILKASAWLDDKANVAEAAKVIGGQAFVNAPAADIEGRLVGRYSLGAGLGERTYEDDYMRFSRAGAVNAPRRAHALWFMAQYRRLGLLADDPPYAQLADSLILRDLYEEVAAAEGVTVPDDDMAPFDVKLDSVVFDPAKPQDEAARP
ncbi:MAG: CmpA/NrtA family ABC transporter substrate-binding protein [Acidimicrobiales bacterium]